MDPKDLAREISILERDLSKESYEKNALKKELDIIRNKIRDNISSLKSAKSERNALTQEVKTLKEERKKLSESVKENSKTAMERGKNPAFLEKEISKIESVIETTVMSHEKEKQLMKVLKEKKAELSELKKKNAALQKFLDQKKKSDSVHKEMVEKAGKSQERHEKLISSSKEIDELRKKEKELRQKFNEKSKVLKELNEKLQPMLLEMGKIGAEARENKNASARQKLQGKIQAVEEKLKKGGKLTTEDIMVLQMGK